MESDDSILAEQQKNKSRCVPIITESTSCCVRLTNKKKTIKREYKLIAPCIHVKLLPKNASTKLRDKNALSINTNMLIQICVSSAGFTEALKKMWPIAKRYKNNGIYKSPIVYY